MPAKDTTTVSSQKETEAYWDRKGTYPFTAIVGQDQMKLALLLNAVYPSIGGVLIRGEKGTAKSTAVRALSALLPEIDVVSDCSFHCDPHHIEKLCLGCKEKIQRGEALSVERRKTRVVDLPLGATEDRVIGSFDVEYAIKKGGRRFIPGLLAEGNRGILYIDEVNLLNDHLVDVILDAASMGVNIVEREGISFCHPAEFILVGTMNPEEGELRPQLLDRFGMCIEARGLSDARERVRLVKRRERFDWAPMEFIESYCDAQQQLADRIVQARKLLGTLDFSEDLVRLCSHLAVESFVAGHRADIAMRKTAMAVAAFDSRREVEQADVEKAAELVLFHRRRPTPPPPPPQEQQPNQQQDNPEKERDDQEQDRQEPQQQENPPEPQSESIPEERNDPKEISAMPIPDVVFPIGDTFKVRRIHMERDRVLRKGSGRRSRTRTSSKAGSYIASTMRRTNDDLALDATIRAAAPYQKRRQRVGISIAIEESDIREKVREKRIGNFIVFVVDASGSMGAGKRMVETKGAILSLLLDAYQKRDRVAMVAFKGDGAELLLPPTNSVELTYKLLEELPTGGRTPMNHGLSLGYQVIENFFRKDPSIYPLLILISDGRVNVNLYGGKPIQEAMEIANSIKEDGRIKTIVIDVEKAGLLSFGLARQLAAQMGSKYFRVEDLKAEKIIEVLREDLVQ